MRVTAALAALCLFVAYAARAADPAPAAAPAAPAAAAPAAEAAAPAAEKKSDRELMEEHLELMERAASKIRDYTCTFTKQEVVNNEQMPMENVYMEFKRPHCVYLKWVKEPHLGRQVLFCQGKYDNKLQAREASGFASIVGTVSLDPTGSLAMRGNRHPILRAGIFKTLQLLRENFDKAAGNNFRGATFTVQGDVTIRGQASECGTTVFTEPGYYAYKTEICMHKKLNVLTRVRIWEKSGRLVEHYEYSDWKLNPGLADDNFTVERLKR